MSNENNTRTGSDETVMSGHDACLIEEQGGSDSLGKSMEEDELVGEDEEKGEETKQEEGHPFVLTSCSLEGSNHGKSWSSCEGLLRKEYY
jgi:hypothetical protein